jgi:hypothetical protein
MKQEGYMRIYFWMWVSAMILLLNLVDSVSAEKLDVKFKINGQVYVTGTGEPEPYINTDSRTMVPIRFFANALGVKDRDITWEPETLTATLIKDDREVKVTLGERFILVNGTKINMDTQAELTDERLFIPVRFIAEGLGASISWEQETNTVILSTDEGGNGNEEMLPVEEKPKHNFEEYGLTPQVELPATLTVNGFSVTVEELFIYKWGSLEANALHEKYDFLHSKGPQYLFRVKVTLKNDGDKKVQFGAYDLNDKFYFMAGYQNSLVHLKSSDFEKYTFHRNHPEILWTYAVEPGQSVSSYAYYMDYTGKADSWEFVAFGIDSPSPDKPSKSLRLSER